MKLTGPFPKIFLPSDTHFMQQNADKHINYILMLAYSNVLGLCLMFIICKSMARWTLPATALFTSVLRENSSFIYRLVITRDFQ